MIPPINILPRCIQHFPGCSYRKGDRCLYGRGENSINKQAPIRSEDPTAFYCGATESFLYDINDIIWQSWNYPVSYDCHYCGVKPFEKHKPECLHTTKRNKPASSTVVSATELNIPEPLFCEVCGNRNPTMFVAPKIIWERYMGKHKGLVVCIYCFDNIVKKVDELNE